MTGFIILGVICVGVIGVGKLVQKVIHAESVPPYVAALNESTDENLKLKSDMFDFGNVNYELSTDYIDRDFLN